MSDDDMVTVSREAMTWSVSAAGHGSTTQRKEKHMDLTTTIGDVLTQALGGSTGSAAVGPKVGDAVLMVAADALASSKSYDAMTGIDSAHLIERLS